MTLLFIRLPFRHRPEPPPRQQIPFNRPVSEQEKRSYQKQVVDHLQVVRANYHLERRNVL